MATTIEEDFSFPAAPLPRFLDSPPLWRSRPTGKEVKEGERAPLQEFTSSPLGEEGEEKMDMLWEDLNEDQLARNCSNSNVSSLSRRGVQMSCVKGLKLAKGNGSIVPRKKTSIIVFIKILKKVFLMHNSQLVIKKKP